MLEVIVWRYRTGSPWRDLPAEFGPWQTAWKRHRRFSGDPRDLGKFGDRLWGNSMSAVSHQRAILPANHGQFKMAIDRGGVRRCARHSSRSSSPANPPEGNVVRNVLEHGVGGINVDSARFADDRWPTKVAFDPGHADALDVPTGTWQGESLSRMFPIFRFDHKPSAVERPRAFGVSHTTVKPLALMQWLITLVAPPRGVVLEPFAGWGTTVEASLLEGFRHHCARERPGIRATDQSANRSLGFTSLTRKLTPSYLTGTPTSRLRAANL